MKSAVSVDYSWLKIKGKFTQYNPIVSSRALLCDVPQKKKFKYVFYKFFAFWAVH